MEPNASESEPEAAEPPGEEKPDYDLINVSLPPYYVVSYCSMIGFDRPEDRPWREIERSSPFFASETLACSCSEVSRVGSRWSQLQAFQPIRIYMHRCFFRDNGKITFYRIGQCPACKTIYWSEDE
jgi:hypothetical protein